MRSRQQVHADPISPTLPIEDPIATPAQPQADTGPEPAPLEPGDEQEPGHIQSGEVLPESMPQQENPSTSGQIQDGVALQLVPQTNRPQQQQARKGGSLPSRPQRAAGELFAQPDIEQQQPLQSLQQQQQRHARQIVSAGAGNDVFQSSAPGQELMVLGDDDNDDDMAIESLEDGEAERARLADRFLAVQVSPCMPSSTACRFRLSIPA